ncbi:MAG TPA: AAA domain-containing protein [Pirellulaceae bacterium]|nr:AAA domain-containing protein [Pirellulaceae bacterium]
MPDSSVSGQATIACDTIRFLRSCYEADNREMAVANLLKKSIRHLTFLNGEEHLLCEMLSRVPLDRQQAIVAQKEAHLHQREKSLLYCAFPIVGQLAERDSRSRILCAPLLFYPATLVIEEQAAFVEIDLSRQRVNTPILSAILAQNDNADIEFDDLLNELPQAPLKRSEVHLLIALLHDSIPHLDAWELAQFPRLHDEKQVRQAIRTAEATPNHFACLPACAIGLVPNSPETRGVLFELDELAKGATLSIPLKVVIEGINATADQRTAPHKHRVPTVLSRHQQQVLRSAAAAPLSLVVGPPGTGKSYTIAATAIDHLSRGEAVLIACRTQQAVDVIGDMIDKLLGPNQCVIRGGQGQNQPALKEFLEQILQGIRVRISLDEETSGKDTRRSNRELEHLERRIAKLESTITRHLRDEQLWGELAAASDDSLLARAVNHVKRVWLDRRLRKQPPIWERIGEYQDSLHESDKLTRELLKEGIEDRIDESLKTHRRDLTMFLKSLRTRSSTRQQELFSEVDPRILFGAFPIWLTAIPEASGIIPLQKELFDVAIIDEATQCDMASCLPIFQRAKRAVVVGDPQQLRHVSFLSEDRLRHLGDDFGLSEERRQQFHYRKNSILDLLNESITSQEHVHFLDEHFRSMPQIIRFSNGQFYGNSLSVMRLSPETEAARCVVSVFVPEGKKSGGANEVEAAAVVDALFQLVDSQAELSQQACQSIGVLSPFRDQVDLIAKRLEERLPLAAFERHQLRVGTAHAFQGDERDVMFLSLAIDAESHSASLRFLERPNLLNVAITRARHLQYVFHSILPAQLPADSLLRRYLESVSHAPVKRNPRTHVIADRFLQEVASELSDRNFQTWHEYELAGQHIDLVVGRAGRTLGIDLIGYPGQYGRVLDLERYRILKRAGFPLLPLPYSHWQQDRANCLRAIEMVFAEAKSSLS